MAEDVREVRRAREGGGSAIAIANLEHIKYSAEKLLRRLKGLTRVS